MINKEFKNCKNLLEYYTKVKDLQEKHHGSTYTLVHDELATLLLSCISYTEFGVAQGGTLAIPCLLNIKKIRGYEIDLKHYNKASNYFENWTKENNIDFKIIKDNTVLCPIIDNVDLLYIDSFHYPDHLTKELNRHSHKVNKYIIIHDTNINKLRFAIENFIKYNRNWNIITDCKINVGFTTIEKIK